jgi:hypothetical protein
MIIFRLCIKGIPLNTVHDDLVYTLGVEGLTSSPVTKYAQSGNFVAKKDGPFDEPATLESSSVDEAIETELAERPFSSIGELSGETCLPRSTVRRQITSSLRFGIRHLR